MKILGVETPKPNDDPGGASTRGISRLSIVHECAMKWALRYQARLRPKAKPHDTDRIVGQLIHTMLAYSYAERMEVPPAWLFDRPLDREINRTAAGRPETIDIAQAAVDAYRRYFAGESDQSTAVEHEVAVPLSAIDPDAPEELRDEMVTGRFDRIYEANGRIIAEDHKTAASRAQRLYPLDAHRYSVNRQVLLYLYLLRAAFPDREIGGFVIRQIKQYPPFDFRRSAVTIDAQAYTALPALVTTAIEREIALSRALAARKPQRSGVMLEACRAYNRQCDYYALCWAGDAAERERIQREEYER